MASEVYDHFVQLCEEVEEQDIDIVLSMFKKTMKSLIETSPKTALTLVEMCEGMLNYDNYLTEEEAEQIVSSLTAQDGTRAGKWKDADTVFRKLEALDIPISTDHGFNKWAMFCTINRISSDYGIILNELSGGDSEKYFELCGKMALATLEDIDSPGNIRRYHRLQN